ncbi:MAG: response regulator transcription factor [Rhodocyclaceae bacterium]|nr:response regulator transcription factor [Rhodocyclaceae bacterium]
MNEATVFVVDDDAAVRAGIALLLETAGLRHECHASGEDFLAAWHPLRFGCVLLDLRMQGMDGIATQEELTRRGSHMPVIFLSAFGDVPTTVRAMRGGALDFMTKPVDGGQLVSRVFQALRTSEQDRNVAAAVARYRAGVASLTERERSVLALAITGSANKAIADQLGISSRTVEVHRAHIVLKLGIGSVMELHTHGESLGVTVHELLGLG